MAHPRRRSCNSTPSIDNTTVCVRCYVSFRVFTQVVFMVFCFSFIFAECSFCPSKAAIRSSLWVTDREKRAREGEAFRVFQRA